ncbi:MAG TPA: MerR family transcriptional regulator, partial [Firmicutes bacterium]|nr:MerR family transcriptional regulator [Bacillota bacterium]
KMNYSIQEISKKTGLTISTLRYYDKEGLFPFLKRKESNYRVFTELELETLRIIACFKKAGLSIPEIREYMQLIQEGDETLKERLNIMKHQKEELEKQKHEIEESLACVERKISYYEQAINDGTEKYVHDRFLKERGLKK